MREGWRLMKRKQTLDDARIFDELMMIFSIFRV
jgi:hypothetical protein